MIQEMPKLQMGCGERLQTRLCRVPAQAIPSQGPARARRGRPRPSAAGARAPR
jgi:hypothetical protein